ncbi:serine/threonine-protein kinase TBK1-like [Styela clava]
MHRGSGVPQSMKQTSKYVWSTNDVLGQGATGSVYRGRNKRTGEQYAIKVFNSFNYMARPAEVRSREFEVLRKVDHRNIVRLFDVEEEISTKHSVIVMELCGAGSLFSMLDDPENMYGLSEDAFKIVLHDITAGMNHLREKGIVHRDLKPGNIMRTWADDGNPVYKLTDFGAARELDDNEQFVSLYGTEEYLHPDIYERAVLRKPAGKTFTASVDLWSMGVTLYHVATGQLPFRPYGGARRNKETMYKITTEKPSGVISGTQHTEAGQIEWSQELPKTCRLSLGFKAYFTPVLAGIMECDPHQIWTFEQYFSEVSGLLEKRVIDVFSVPSGALHKIYIPEGNTFASFQEKIAEQTDIRSSHQSLFLEGDVFEVETFQPVKEYPRTTRERPIILLSTNISDFQSIHIPHTCKPPKDRQKHPMTSLETDANFVKVCSSTLFDIRKSVDYLLLVQTLIRLGVKWFVSYLRSWVSRAQISANEINAKIECLKTSLEIFEEHYNRETALLRIMGKMSPSPPEVNELKLFFPQITEKNKQLRQLKTEFELVSEAIRGLERSIVQDKTPLRVFVDEGSQESDHLVEKMDVIANRSRDIYKAFKKHKHLKRLSSHEEQVHKFDKQQLNVICEKAVSLFTEKSVPGCKKMHKESNSWFTSMQEFQSQLRNVESRLGRLRESCEQQNEQQLQMQRFYRNKFNGAEQSLNGSMSRLTINGQSSLPEMKPASWPEIHKTMTTKQNAELKNGIRDAKNSFVDIRSVMDDNTLMLQRLRNLLNSVDDQSSMAIIPPPSRNDQIEEN